MSVQDRLLYAQALVPDAGMKLAVVEDIRQRADRGGISPADKPTLFILRSLIDENVRSEIRSPTATRRNFPEVRVAACRVLGQIGGETARGLLLSVLKYDYEPMVLSEAVYGLGKLGGRPDEETIDTIVQTIRRHVLPGKMNNLAFACLLAVDSFDPGFPGLENSDLFMAILSIRYGPFVPEVRGLAERLSDKIRRLK
jgi:hypothetical protein